MCVMTTPVPATIIETVELPRWWSTANTVLITLIAQDGPPTPEATFNVVDLDIMASGIGTPANPGAGWNDPLFIPWGQVVNIAKVS
jgi:hypothetical protein